MQYDAQCHCGAISWTTSQSPDWITECNCSFCRSAGVRWAEPPRQSIQIIEADNARSAYIWGDKTLAFIFCRHCGCYTHWESLDSDSDRLKLNFALCDPAMTAHLKIRQFDGADRFEYLD